MTFLAFLAFLPWAAIGVGLVVGAIVFPKEPKRG